MVGGDADPRYSLANERTFLAWIRTSLGMLAVSAGLVAIDLPWPAFAEADSQCCLLRRQRRQP